MFVNPLRWIFLLLLCMATASVSARSAAPDKRPLEIPMRDGSALAADLYLPRDYSAEKFPDGLPVVLVCTPYDKSRDNAVGLWRDCLVAHGYAFIVEDMRGFHASAGAGRGAPRHDDGYDTIEWIARQVWCTGKVGMIGYSHLGAAQYEAAVTAPPHLACAIPAQAPGNYYTDVYYPPRFRKADMETIWRGRITSRTAQLLRRRARSRNDSRIGQFNVPMLHSGGWYDFYTEGAVEMFLACQQDGGPRARGTQRLLIGPWGHGVAQEQDPDQPLRLPGGLAYPANSKLDWEHDVWLPWFDHWLKGKQTALDDQPLVRYYLIGDVNDPQAPGNEWIETNQFPPESHATAYFAHVDGTLSTTASTAAAVSLKYEFDPKDPVPTVGRYHWNIPVKGPYDQREVEGRPDVLVFTTATLERPLKIVGRIQADVWASSDRKDTDFTARLTDVYPDGRSMTITDSIVKGRYRNTYEKEELLTPGRPYQFEIDLGYTAIVLAPGHRLRLAVSSSNFDRFDINPNTGRPYGDHALSRKLLTDRLRGGRFRGEPTQTEALVAANTIYLERDHPTRVVLPIVPSKDSE
jgi:predicted acyl esterase